MNQRSAARLVTAVTAAAAAVVATSGAVAYAKPPSGGGSGSGSTTGITISGTPFDTAPLAPQSDWAVRVATTTLSGSTSGSGGPTALPSQLSASQMPKTPDVGDEASANAPVASSLSRKYLHKVSSVGSAPTVNGNTVAGATTGLLSVSGLNAYNEGVTHLGANGQLPGVDVEPPDQGLCAGSGYVLEMNNMVVEAFSGSSLTAEGAASLESLFATPEVFAAGNDGSYSIQGDPRCFYDPQSGRWFASQLWLNLTPGSSSKAVQKFDEAGTFVAVSQTSSPVGKWNVYFVPELENATASNTCTISTGANPCFGDQPLLNVDGGSVQISTNEYSVNGAYPAGSENMYFVGKSQLLGGASKAPVHWAPVGYVKVPTYDNPYNYPWYSIAPAQVPNGKYLTANNGTSYGLSSLDLASTGDTHIAEWAFTNTNNANSMKSSVVDIYETLLNSGAYAFAPYNAAQKSGPTPLGDYWNALNGAHSNNPLPEGQIATNDDRMTTVAYDPSNGALIGGLNTAVNQRTNATQTQPLTGVAYFTVTPAGSLTLGLVPSSVTTGYLSPTGANAIFPAVAITSHGTGVMTYSLTGSGYYPSTAYSTVAPGDQVGSTVHVARAGVGPQDGFTEYQSYGTALYRPRWGDYSTAVVNTVGGAQVVDFATEMIGQSCTDSQFAADFTCGGTRDLFANWGTSVNQLTP